MLHNENMVLLCRVKQWIALNARSDWVLKLRISFDIHFQATRAGFALENILIVAGINEFKLSLCALLSQYFNIHLAPLFSLGIKETFP